eukprot:8076798-Pyramimonas_sp.AAC.1
MAPLLSAPPSQRYQALQLLDCLNSLGSTVAFSLRAAVGSSTAIPSLVPQSAMQIRAVSGSGVVDGAVSEQNAELFGALICSLNIYDGIVWVSGEPCAMGKPPP